MAETTPAPLDGVTSLYRRFRPGRFAELRGQDHVVRALQGAVKNGRVSHAYLFSGPRGTGKTTTARILAKALNCESPKDGDACNACASCVAITRGSSLDVIELDAASNNGVDDIREITAGAWHGTTGRWKVYIFDEVHQLSKAASAALLKTLEEPPAHVVFVLATTDPHKVLPTIRSRTQHLEFRLLGGETLNELLSDVRGAAGLDADNATIEAAVRLGRGSARDALSALDQLVATGSVESSRPEFDDLFRSLVDADAAGALRALATLSAQGWEPEQLAESFAAEVRQAFLLLVAPDVADAVDADRERLRTWGEALGLARTVRVLETFGRSMREMRSAPEKNVVIEVALVRLVRPELDQSLEALDERLTRLERGAPAAAVVATPPPAPARRPIGASAPTPPPTPATSPTPPPVPEAAPPAPPATTVASAPTTVDDTLTLASVRERFTQHVIPRLARSAQLLLRNADLRALEGSRLTIALANESLRAQTEKIVQGLRGAMEHEFKTTLQIDWIVDGALEGTASAPRPSASSARRAAPPAPVDVDAIDEELDGDVSVAVHSVPEHLISEFFPGAEEVS